MTDRAVWLQLEGAFLDGRLEFTGYKHKQLCALFEHIQRGGTSTSDEVYHVLQSISQLIDSLPKNLHKAHAKRQALRDVTDGSRKRGAGPVVIRQNDHYPTASWAIPLAQAIVDGNSAVVVGTARVPLDDAFAFVPDFENTPTHTVALGHASLIVDQSISRILRPDEEARGVVLSPVRRAAERAAALIRHSEPSLGYPAYLLVHENIVLPFVRALEPLVDTEVKVQPLTENRQQVESFLCSLDGQLPSFIPIYSIRSIDSAIDFIQSQDPRFLYVLAAHSFGAYVANSTHADVSINPETPTVLGPYAKPKRFSSTRDQIVICDHSERAASPANVSAWKLKQPLGKRIDFFGGSFLFSAGLTFSILMGGLGYGIYGLIRYIRT